MKKMFSLFSGILTILFAGACCTRTEIPPQESIMLDVRSKAEYDQKHIPGSILIPHEQISAEIQAKVPDRNTPIALFCRSGRRSAITADVLKKLGYTRVYDLGGISDAAKILNKSVVSAR